MKNLKLSEEFYSMVAGTALADEDTTQTLKLLIAKDLEPLMEKKIRGEIELMMQSKMSEAA